MPAHIIDYRKLYREWADKFLTLGDVDEAVVLLKRLIELYPGHTDSYSYLANLLLDVERFDEAFPYAEHALKLDRQDETTSTIYARLLLAQKKFEELVPFLSNSLTSFPHWHNLRRVYATTLTELKQFNDAVAQWHSIIQASPLYDDVASLALTLALGGARKEALDLTGQLLSSPATTPQGLTTVGKVLLELGESSAYMQLLQDTVKLHGGSEQIFYEWGKGIAKLGDPLNGITLMKAGFPFSVRSLVRKGIREIQEDFQLPPPTLHHWKKSAARRVVFVAENPKIREAKLAYGLRKMGWEVILVHVKPINSDPTKYFDACYTYKNSQEALNIIDGLDCKLLHVFSSLVDSTILTLLKERPGVVIFDTIDVFDGMIYFHHDHMVAQRSCFEEADALVCRDLQIAESNRLSGRFRAEDLIFFPEYCWNFSEELPQRHYPKDEIHVLQGGWINVQNPEKKTFQTYLDFLTRLAECGIHVHLYAHMMFKKEDFDREYGDLVALGKKTGCAHLHDTVPFDQVPSEFAKYDFGLSVVPRADYPGHASRFPKQGGHFAYCGSARNTDYMDAALPTLCSPLLHFQHRMLKRYSLELTYTDELLNDPVATLRPYCNRETRQKVIERRRSYTIDAQTPRLSAFYEKLQKKHGLI